MDILFRHTWIMFIIVTVVNGLIIKHRSKKHIVTNPALADGYEKAFRTIILYGNIPWIIMMIGNLSGLTENTFEYFNPKAMNPIVLVFHASIIFLWALSFWWIYFNNGANFIENHPELVQKASFNGDSNLSAKQIKIFFPLIILGGIIAMIMM